MIIDEVHHTPAETFSNLFYKCNCEYILGLTATMERKDGLHSLLSLYIGPVLYEAKREDAKDVSVRTVPYMCGAYCCPEPRTVTGEIAISRMVNMVCENVERTEIIVKIIREFMATSRRVLVLSDRREHCLQIAERVGEDAGVYIGGMGKKESEVSLEKRVIVATYSLVSEGFDIPTLDTLVLASPRSNVVQSVGRILRETPGKKNAPLVVDIHDTWSVFHGQQRKRATFYKRSGFLTEESPSDNEGSGYLFLD